MESEEITFLRLNGDDSSSQLCTVLCQVNCVLITKKTNKNYLVFLFLNYNQNTLKVYFLESKN